MKTAQYLIIIWLLAACCLLHLLQPCASKTTHPAPKSAESEQTVGSRILGQKAGPRGRFPYVCSLKRRGDREHICVGILIGSQWLLTTASCLDPSIPGATGLSPLIACDVYQISPGVLGESFAVYKAFMHEAWNGNVTDGNDIALLLLNSNNTLPYVSIEGSKSSYPWNKKLSVVGWGINTETGEYGRLQRLTTVTYVSRTKCNKDEWWHGDIKKSMHCALAKERYGCVGESGAPLLELNSTADDVRLGFPAADVLVGITSFGPAVCNGSVPEVYTSLQYYSEWITDTIKKQEAEYMPTKDPPSKSPEKKKPVSLKEPKKTTSESTKSTVKTPESPKEETKIEGPQCDETCLIQDFKIAILSDSDSDALTLLSKGVDPNTSCVIEGFDRPFLLHAAIKKSWSVVKVLIDAKADIEVKDPQNYTVLFYAVEDECTNIVQALIDAGANVNAASTNYTTPLHIASGVCNLEITKKLLHAGASRSVPDVDGKKAYDVICTKQSSQLGDDDVIKQLKRMLKEKNCFDSYT